MAKAARFANNIKIPKKRLFFFSQYFSFRRDKGFIVKQISECLSPDILS